MNQRIRIVYFGTPAYAVPTLRALAMDERYDVSLVVTQPDRQAGRGRTLQAPQVKLAAIELGLPVYQPVTLRDPESRAPIAAADADIFVVAAYGLIFGPKTLALPRHGCLNLHASLLPHYRGASPISAAVLSGDEETGVSLMVMERGLDTGPVVATITTPISQDDTTETLTIKLGDDAATLAREQIARHIPEDIDGNWKAQVQNNRLATVARQLTKADGWLDWTDDAAQLERRVRAMWNWPRAWTTANGEQLQVHRASVISLRADVGVAKSTLGTVRRIGDDAVVSCGGQLALRLDTVQPAGGKAISGVAWLSGRKRGMDLVLGVIGAPAPQPPMIVPASTA